MAAAIKREHGITAEYIKSNGGVFEVMIDGDLVYSKKATGVFPQNEHILSLIKERNM